MSLLVTVEALNLKDIFHFFFDGISVSTYGVSTHCRRVVTTTSPITLTPKTSLFLVPLASLTLVGGKLLVLVTKHVSKKGVSRLSPFKIFVLLLGGLVLLETPGIDFSDFCRWL